ncbi:winged helix DNA-binding domain-containing protein, partial [Neoconidiobolus thromboides FSU 785]
ISWSEDGLSFIIHDKVEFQGLVLPKYFDSSKIESFSRQLNLYGFQRSSDGRKQRNVISKSTSFTHPYFIRDKPYLIKYIKRK